MKKANGMVAALVAGTLMGCGGGGGGNVRIEGPEGPDIEPNSVLYSDMRMVYLGETVWITDVECSLQSRTCAATLHGQRFMFPVEEDVSDVDGTIYSSYGSWKYHVAGAAILEVDGAKAVAGLSGGATTAGSLPPTGSARWDGTMVALDSNDRVVRGESEIEIPDLARPRVNATLRPSGHASLTWRAVTVTGGQFRTTGLKGEFYGPGAEEVGGVFNRAGLIGAFAAGRQ